MKKNRKYLTALVALVFGTFFAAHADTLSLASYSGSSSAPDVANTATTYNSAASIVNSGSTSTFDIASGSVWHSALGSSSWVSFNALTGPTSGLVVPNGDYLYNTQFNLGSSASNYVGSLSVLADDTVSIYLNGKLILEAAGPLSASNDYSHCSDVGPNCVTPLTFSFTGFDQGMNDLTFDVKQVAGVDEGLDFAGTISSVPEPASLMLFGTGLLGIVGVTRRCIAGK
ncbi:PEP-CTERM sorting domain-containing protein [Tunturiibacter gelidoferens]|uniref:Ice-binding protein C-terminal domain-containing protein n=2 Tax=Tunturiibacter TaxID=3154218 RepID=A0A7Y9NIY4_9BACT|nr:PEP-CTERM sorting domain-containing protein [Edaphobacter lichenicola]MBB5340522.1 hypothetical protein [Edaphobacter lichenicola]NYF50164.1 hypothetical protein [Edaphobacter lichenicola]